MNSTFKVVFNKARGALMVVNEVTSSVQAKGTKTVIAAAVASLVAGAAMAADTTALTVNWAEDTAVEVVAGKKLDVAITAAEQNNANTTVKTVTVSGGEMNVTAGNRLINHGLADTKFIVNSGKVTVSGKNIGGVASTIDSDVVEINGGEITVGDGANANYIDGYESVTMTGGTLTIKKGAHVAVG